MSEEGSTAFVRLVDITAGQGYPTRIVQAPHTLSALFTPPPNPPFRIVAVLAGELLDLSDGPARNTRVADIPRSSSGDDEMLEIEYFLCKSLDRWRVVELPSNRRVAVALPKIERAGQLVNALTTSGFLLPNPLYRYSLYCGGVTLASQAPLPPAGQLVRVIRREVLDPEQHHAAIERARECRRRANRKPWTTAGPGLNAVGTCYNPRCVAYMCRGTVCVIGTGRLEYPVTTTCPLCEKALTARQAGFVQCQVETKAGLQPISAWTPFRDVAGLDLTRGYLVVRPTVEADAAEETAEAAQEAQPADACPICAEPDKSTNMWFTLGCRHKFHTACLSYWATEHQPHELAAQNLFSCPICRATYPTGIFPKNIPRPASLVRSLQARDDMLRRQARSSGDV
jgi:hypothetical protein